MPDLSISTITAREVLDCRGLPTVQVDVVLDDGTLGRADVPSGRSTGSYEAHELRDGGNRFGGFGVRGAVANVNDEIAPALVGERRSPPSASSTRALIELDGTADKSRLGAQRDPRRLAGRRPRRGGRARAAALPLPERQRARAAGAAGQPDQRRPPRLQRPRLPGVHRHPGRRRDHPGRAPDLAPRSTSQLAEILLERYGKVALNTGDEGGFAPPISDPREALGLHEAVGRGRATTTLSATASTAPRPTSTTPRPRPTRWPASATTGTG